ncbi:putative NADH-flavin reductase [Streptomyces sp. TLI_55]|uniref:NAD(P)-dependent oxidoreductase n=1 Tax=Streptomyces sp. TLI_55 TaxID=1938861 RepID=UPI000BC7934B|nr:NAD(P)H-binding protein [Streptomyces sp. TLI_55]SNX61758.1 putative NADH-flavin reductase [Streptomyces sp. TLI_55]
MNIVVFGANGPTGRQVVEQAVEAGHTVTAVTRHPESFPVDGARVVLADVYDPAAVERAVAGQDAVVSALGVPYGRDRVTVYSTGVTHIARAMAGHGVRRLVAVTSTVLFGTPAPGENFLFRKVLEPSIARFMGRTVYEDMRRMEEVLRRSELEWTVLRPGGLFDAEEVSAYEVGTERLPGRYTARPDLARELLRQAVEERRHVGRYVDVRTTQNTPSLFDLIRKEAVGGRAVGGREVGGGPVGGGEERARR